MSSSRSAYQNQSPDGMRALGGVHAYLAQSGLPKPLLDLVYLRASQINGCSFCIDSHTRDLLSEGVDVFKLMLVSVWHEAGGWFSDRERAALRWTESVTMLHRTHVPDEDFDAVRSQFSAKELSDLTLAIGLINAYNRVGVSLRLGPRPAPEA